MSGFVEALKVAGRRFAMRSVPRTSVAASVGACLLVAWPVQALAVSAVKPTSDDEVVEVLTSVTHNRLPRTSAVAAVSTPADAAAAALQAREAISVARQTGDTRYWGRAQAILNPWWDKADAPANLAVLQATVQQGRHEFSASRAVLTAALTRAPGLAQGWLNLAALERLSGRYAESLAACAAVERAGQAFYAQACRLETKSLQGQQTEAAQGFQALLDLTKDAGQRSWLLSLLAESQERAGNDAAAATAYAASLAAEPDLYTSIAYSDLLLRTGKTEQALELLAPLPETDPVVVRRGTAWKRLGDARWKGQRALLKERVQEQQRRGDDIMLHSRELALTALWLDDEPAKALPLATRNLDLQHEPVDWWIALQSAYQAGQGTALTDLKARVAAIGLQDMRLTQVDAATPGAKP